MGHNLKRKICMLKSKSVELRSSDVKEKCSKPVLLLRGVKYLQVATDEVYGSLSKIMIKQ